MTMLCTFRVTLFAGFMGSAVGRRDNRQLPSLNLLVPACQPFGWFRLTTIQACLQAEALLMGTLLDGYRIRLPVLPPFHPASRIDG